MDFGQGGGGYGELGFIDRDTGQFLEGIDGFVFGRNQYSG